MEKDIGKIKKNEMTDIVIRMDDFGGKPGLTIREFTNSEGYTGFTKSGTRIPAEKFLEFKEMINSVEFGDVSVSKETKPAVKKDQGFSNPINKEESNGKAKIEDEEIEEDMDY